MKLKAIIHHPTKRKNNFKMNRKQFIQSFFRYGILGGIMVLIGFILLKRKVSIESRCNENFACKNCNKYSACSLPEKS